ncbi:MAG: shikimate dehydrogenase [Xenococcus sp. (in: cyanobacteria)]
MTNPTIEIDLGEILKEIKSDQKDILKEISEIKKDTKADQKAISDEISNLRVGQARLEEKFNSLEKDHNEFKESTQKSFDDLKELIKELKNTQETLASDVADLKGAKSLIIPIVVAVTTAILTLVARTIPLG